LGASLQRRSTPLPFYLHVYTGLPTQRSLFERTAMPDLGQRRLVDLQIVVKAVAGRARRLERTVIRTVQLHDTLLPRLVSRRIVVSGPHTTTLGFKEPRQTRSFTGCKPSPVDVESAQQPRLIATIPR